MSHFMRAESRTEVHGDDNTIQSTATGQHPPDVIVTSTNWVTISKQATQDTSIGSVRSTITSVVTSTATQQQSNSVVSTVTHSATVNSTSSVVKAYSAVQSSGPGNSGLSCAEQVTIPSVLCGVELIALLLLLWRQFGHKFPTRRKAANQSMEKNQDTEKQNASATPATELQPTDQSRPQMYGPADYDSEERDDEYEPAQAADSPSNGGGYETYRGEKEQRPEPTYQRPPNPVYQQARDTYMEPEDDDE